MPHPSKFLAVSALALFSMVATAAIAHDANDPKSSSYEETFIDADTGKSIKLRGTKASIDAWVAAGKYKQHTNPREWTRLQDSKELNAALHKLKDGEALVPVVGKDGRSSYQILSASEARKMWNADEIQPERPRQRREHKMDKVRLGPGDMADGLTTAIGLAKEGVEEANPLLSGLGDGASVGAVALKYGIKHVLVARGNRPAAVNYGLETMGWGAACANIMTVAGAAAPPALIVGVGCYFLARDKMRTGYEATTGRAINGRYLTNAEWDAAIAKQEGKTRHESRSASEFQQER